MMARRSDYESIDGGRKKLGWAGSLVLTGAAVLALGVATLSATDLKESAKGAVRQMYVAGHSMEQSGTEAPQLVAMGCEACSCEKDNVAELKVLSQSKTISADFLSPTVAPTSDKTWDLYWTDGDMLTGKIDESYIWTTSEDYVAKRAIVLVDTLGLAYGLDIDANATTVYFTVDGCIAKVDTSGYDLAELVCYDDVTGTDMRGLAIFDRENKVYWVDYETGNLYQTDAEGNDGTYTTLYSGFDSPVGVTVDSSGDKIYVSDSKGIWRMDPDATDVTQVYTGTDCQGLDIDEVNRAIYWVDGPTLFYDDISDSLTGTSLYTSLSSPVSVTVDGDKNLVFYTATDGVYMGDSAGNKATYVAEVADARFAAVLSESVPTPMPTSAPTSHPTLAPIPVPTHVPSSAPIPVPTPAPSSLPTSRPTDVPIPEPTPVPSFTPTGRPTSLPSAAPVPVPTVPPSPVPTPLPTYPPSSVPSPIPSPSPSSAPTSMPTPQCWKWMVDCGYCDGSGGYECTEVHVTRDA